MATEFVHRVRYHEADAQGFLFNSRHLEIADVALTELFREHGWPYEQLVSGGTDPSVVSATVPYRRPAASTTSCASACGVWGSGRPASVW